MKYEYLWVDTFRGLRDGNPEIETWVRSGGAFIKKSGTGQQQVFIQKFGDMPRVITQPKFSTTPDELRTWKMRVQEEEDQFEADMMSLTSLPFTAPAIPAERGLWEALKRAETGAQVRRICKRSKIWLKTRRDFPGGGFADYWYWRRVLYERAEEFCRAKLDARYPSRDQRKSGDYRRIEYLARVMAGLTLRLAPSTAVEIIRKLKHSAACSCWRCRFRIAPRYPTSLAVFLSCGDWFRGG